MNTRRKNGLAALVLAMAVVVVVALVYLTGPLAKRGRPPQNLTEQLRVVPLAVSTAVDRIRMVDARAGWAVAGTYILRTEDGGRTWLDATPGEVKGALGLGQGATGQAGTGSPAVRPDVFFLDGTHAWVIFAGADPQAPAAIYRTADGGLTWRKSNSQVAGMGFGITFVDAGHGWVLAHRGVAAGSESVAIAGTKDGGATWTVLSDASGQGAPPPGTIPFGGNKTGVAFRDPSVGWLSGFAPLTGKAFMYVTQDSGKTWQQAYLPAPVTYREAMFTTYPPVFFGAKDGLIPASFGEPGQPLVIYATHDGGATWTPGAPVTSDQNNLFVWSFADAVHGFATDGAALYRTVDGGVSWSKVQPAGSTGGSGGSSGGGSGTGSGSKGIETLSFISDQIGWAVGGGVIRQTSDGGRTWTKLVP